MLFLLISVTYLCTAWQQNCTGGRALILTFRDGSRGSGFGFSFSTDPRERHFPNKTQTTPRPTWTWWTCWTGAGANLYQALKIMILSLLQGSIIHFTGNYPSETPNIQKLNGKRSFLINQRLGNERASIAHRSHRESSKQQRETLKSRFA